MVRVGRDLCGSPSPTPCPSRITQSRLHSTVARGVGTSPEKETPQPSGQPGPGLCHPQREEVLPRVQLELPLPQFVPVAPCPVAGHHCKEPGPVLLTPPLQILIGISKVPSQPSLLQAEQAQLPQPLLVGGMLKSPPHPRSPALGSLAGELGSVTLTLSSLPPCPPRLSAGGVPPRLGELPGSLLQALLHSEELGGRGDTVPALRGAPGHRPDPRRAGLHQR